MNSPTWNLGSKQVDLNTHTHIMGILNVTPDSFSDGGSFLDPTHAIEHGIHLVNEGADLIDIGGESTRPGSESVPESEEIRRVIPVLTALRSACPETVLSIDTSKAGVAKAALDAGAELVNDVTAGRGDPDLFRVVADSDAGIVLMHMQGTPRTMQKQPEYDHPIDDILNFLHQRIEDAVQAGISQSRIAIDPGIGFGKTLTHNLKILAGGHAFHKLGCPVVWGVSRKRWIGDLTGRSVENRLAGSLAGAAACIERGAHILRVHDVAETRDVARVLDAIKHSS